MVMSLSGQAEALKASEQVGKGTNPLPHHSPPSLSISESLRIVES